jgi:hypothetical protein
MTIFNTTNPCIMKLFYLGCNFFPIATRSCFVTILWSLSEPITITVKQSFIR